MIHFAQIKRLTWNLNQINQGDHLKSLMSRIIKNKFKLCQTTQKQSLDKLDKQF
jgi:hypothetical protein